MGYYIEGPTIGKKDYLVNMQQAKEVSEAEAREAMKDESLGVVCIVSVGPWDAAGFCYSLDEFEVFASPRDNRPKRWVVLPRWKAERLSGYDPKAKAPLETD